MQEEDSAYADLSDEGIATEEQRREVTQRVADEMTQRYRGVGRDLVVTGSAAAGDGIAGYNPYDDRITMSLPRLVADTEGLSVRAAAQRVARAFDEELRHKAHHNGAESVYEEQTGRKARAGDGTLQADVEGWRAQHYENIWQREFTAEGRQAVLRAYGWKLSQNGSSIVDSAGKPVEAWKAAFEGIRMLSQERALGNVSERSKLLIEQPQGIIEHLKAALAYLKQLAKKTLSPRIEADIAHIETVLGQWEAGQSVGASPAAAVATNARSAAMQAAMGSLQGSPLWDPAFNPHASGQARIVNAWAAVAQHDEAFRYGRTQSKVADDIAAAVSRPGEN